MKFMCAEAAGGSNIIVYVVLIVMVLAMLILPYFTNKKRNQQYMDMISSIKVGDLVKTAGGIIGKVTKITDKGEIKTIILETGSKGSKSSMEFDISSVYCVLKSTKAEEPKEEKQESKTEDVKDEESKTEEVVAVESVGEAETKTEEKAEEPKKVAKIKRSTTKSKK